MSTSVVAPPVARPQPEVASYRTLREALGWLGFTLPPIVIVGQALVMQGAMRGSLSAYYFTGMRNWFVGSLCAMAVFLACYEGYDRRENRLTNVAGLSAIGVAFCPTTPPGALTTADVVLGKVHLASAAVLFVCLAGMCLEFARLKAASIHLTPERRLKNRIYRSCAAVMVAAIAAMAVLGPTQALSAYRPILWLESLAIMAFGLSWIVKGLPARQDAPTSASTSATESTSASTAFPRQRPTATTVTAQR